jgi:hypothetical protein
VKVDFFVDVLHLFELSRITNFKFGKLTRRQTKSEENEARSDIRATRGIWFTSSEAAVCSLPLAVCFLMLSLMQMQKE